MKILFVSSDIEESARGINFILKSLISAAGEDGHEIGLLTGYPDARVFKKSKNIESKIEHLHLQHYLKEGRRSFRYMVPGGYRKRNVLRALFNGSILKTSTYKVNDDLLAGNAGWLFNINFVIKSPFIYQFMTRNWTWITRHQVRKAVKRYKIDCVIIAAPSIIRKKDVGKAKLVHFVHDTMPFDLLETPPDNNTPSRYAAQFYSTVNESDYLFVNSKDTEKKVHEVNKDANISVLYGAPSSKIDTLPETSAIERYELDRERYLVFVSTVEKRKNVEGLLEAYSIAHDQLSMPLVIVGGPGYGYDEISKKYSSLPPEVRNNIIFTGYVSEEDKYTLLRNACAFIFPSFYEGFGLIIVEAFTAGVPVVTTRKGALPEAAGEGALYIDNPYNVAEISQKMIQIADDSTLRHKLLAGAEKQLKKFTQEKFAQRMHDSLKDIQEGLNRNEK